MRKTAVFTGLVYLALCVQYGLASKTITPTTTLVAETGNNTSAADSFQGTSNGNPAPGNVSKVDTRTLLYSGSTTGIYAHYMPWFGTGYHMNVGYSETDSTQAARQVNDMISRGIQGIIVDWYGTGGTFEDQATQAIFNEIQKHDGFQFAIMEDAGGLTSADKTSELISDLVYAWQKYEQSSNYMRFGGRPVIFFFGVERFVLDWTAIRAQVPGNPIFILENAGAYSLSYSDGGFGWVNGFTTNQLNNWGQLYLDDFYAHATNSAMFTFGSTWKGFNDTAASWSENRVMGQQCGQTWLNTFSELNKFYGANKQLQSLQLVTWNDYEEGTALELGIDNCVSVNGSVSGNQLTWSVNGNESTVHHYTVFISNDGQNLMPVTDVPAGTHSLDLGQFDFADGTYNIYVKAVGQASIRNQMSGVVGWSIQQTPATVNAGNPPAGTDLAVAIPASILVLAGGSTRASVVLTPTGNFSVPVSLSCSGLPAGMNCAFSNAVITPGNSAASTTVTLTSSKTSAKARFGGAIALALWLPTFGMGMVLYGTGRWSRKAAGNLLLLAALVVLVISTGCGITGTKTAGTEATATMQTTSYQMTITAQAGSFQRTATATVILK